MLAHHLTLFAAITLWIVIDPKEKESTWQSVERWTKMKTNNEKLEVRKYHTRARAIAFISYTFFVCFRKALNEWNKRTFCCCCCCCGGGCGCGCCSFLLDSNCCFAQQLITIHTEKRTRETIEYGFGVHYLGGLANFSEIIVRISYVCVCMPACCSDKWPQVKLRVNLVISNMV